MKQTLLFLTSLCVLSLFSCQKKQYASFQNSLPNDYSHKLKKTEVKTVDDLPGNEVILSVAPAENISADMANIARTEIEEITKTEKPIPVTVESYRSKTTVRKKVTLIEKVKAIQQVKKLSKQVSKKSTISTAPKSNADDTLALVSLILGLLGIVLLFFGGWVAILAGLAAMITGIISLKSTTKRILAVIGIVLGAAVLLLGIIVVVFIVSLISNL